MLMLVVLSAMVVAMFICAAWFFTQRGTQMTKSGVVRNVSPVSQHYMGEGVLFAAALATYEVEIEVDGVVHHCCQTQPCVVGEVRNVMGLQNGEKWRAMRVQ